jgi:hypothetical protein
MSAYLTEKYGGSAGAILDCWSRNPLNQEIGKIYEEEVFGQKSIPMDQILSEFYGKSTGGVISYGSDLSQAKTKGIIQG